ncbi:unnamed protein product [Thelazia callipaeda]|uniref:RING-type domain-containing protein n=1 Tax=Thelazia callipaeda TaxID=103827 RepID=A0A158RBC1_THECL|nr:unnamed protein product [Thelazia callipaeda]
MSEVAESVLMTCPICAHQRPVTEMHQLLPCLHIFCSSCISKSFKRECLMLHCFSNIHTETLSLNNCANEKCPRKLSSYESISAGSCKHELCTFCFEEFSKRNPAVCPVAGCNELLTDSDLLGDFCDGCKKSLTDIKYVVTNVLLRSALQIAKCTCGEDCEGRALNGFPSNEECEHDACIDCLERMLNECELTGTPPMCPNNMCRQPYNVESVIALKTLFPQRAKYFDSFDLENQVYYIIKDDTISVYGFYIRREINDERKPDEELVVDAKSITRSVSELNLTSESMVIVDTSGVLIKSAKR